MRRIGGWAALAAVVVAAAPVAAEPRQPTGKWVVDFDAAQCIAYRSFGTDEKPLTLMLKAPATGGVLQLFVVRKGMATDEAEQLDGRLRMADGTETRVTALAYGPSKGGRRVFLYNLPKSLVASWPSSGTLDVRASPGLRESLAVSGLHPLMKVMGECVADLRDSWNFSNDTTPSKNRQRAEGSLAGLIEAEDYPGVSVNGNDAGTVGVVLLLDPKGKVADCSLIETSGVAALDALTCILIKKRAKFKPAIGADGQPARDVFLQRVTWRLQG